MSEEISIEGFFERASKGELYASVCLDCGYLSVPPRKICHKCFSTNAGWKKLKGEGIIESFTIIHVAPKRLEKEAPYAVCLIKLDEGIKILARMKVSSKEELKIGERIKIKAVDSGSQEWPMWPYLIAEKL